MKLRISSKRAMESSPNRPTLSKLPRKCQWNLTTGHSFAILRPVAPPSANADWGCFYCRSTSTMRLFKGLFQKVDQLLTGRRPVDDELLDELEEALIQADLSVHTALRLVEGLRK